MAVKIRDSELSGNGRHGASIGRGVDADIAKLRAKGNKVDGLHVADEVLGGKEPAKPSWMQRFRSDTSVKFAATVTVGLIGSLAAFLWHHFAS